MNAPGNRLAPPRNGFGVAALVLGLLALVSSWTIIGGIVLGILAVIFGVLGRGRARRGEATNGGFSVAGIVLGVIGALIAVALIALAMSLLNTPAGQRYRQCLEQSAGNPDRVERCATEYFRYR
jgi:heme/copper-type cytochrome/quinol oxidase subunit 2